MLHSAAKSTAATGGGGRGQPGKRYCHLCHRCVSANNWVSQHLANTHRAAAPTGLLAISTGDEKTVEVRTLPRRLRDASETPPRRLRGASEALLTHFGDTFGDTSETDLRRPMGTRESSRGVGSL